VTSDEGQVRSKKERVNAGYSKRSLVEKLGIKEGFKIVTVDAPPNYKATLGKLPASTTVTRKLDELLDLIQLFCKDRQTLESKFPALKRAPIERHAVGFLAQRLIRT